MVAPIDPNQDWEIINDDGFVYKRKKRRLDPAAFVAPADPPPDPAAELRHKKNRKRLTLLKIKNKYEIEIRMWEDLSNTLKSIEENVKSKSDQQQIPIDFTPKQPNEIAKSCGSFVEELILQVEAQEAIINNFSHLCDIAESLCDAHEEKTKKSFFDLPIWGTPHQLMASLCED